MKKQIGKIKRKLRNRKKLKDSNLNRLRISVSKSLKNISYGKIKFINFYRINSQSN